MIPIVFAQVDPTPIANGLEKNPLAWGLALTLLALAYMFKLLTAERAAHVQTIKDAAKEQREILQQVVPLTTKLIEALEILERLTKED